MKKTKVVCTIGPASEQKETLEKLIATGMNAMHAEEKTSNSSPFGDVPVTLEEN